ncbi:unnamed protein product [Choristocarpus tenellus]
MTPTYHEQFPIEHSVLRMDEGNSEDEYSPEPLNTHVAYGEAIPLVFAHKEQEDDGNASNIRSSPIETDEETLESSKTGFIVKKEDLRPGDQVLLPLIPSLNLHS